MGKRRRARRRRRRGDQPATLPIFGTLDCYGRVEEIERDANVEFLEKKLGVPIETFAEACSTGLDRSDPNWEKILTALIGPPDKNPTKNQSKRRETALRGMLVHRKAWDKMTSEAPGEGGGSRWSLWDDGLPSVEALKFLGFKFVKETNDERWPAPYNKKFIHPDIPGLVGRAMTQDGSYTDFTFRRKKGRSIYRISDLGKFMRENGAKLPTKMVALARTTPASLMWAMETIADHKPYFEERDSFYKFYRDAVSKRTLKPGFTEKMIEESRTRSSLPEHMREDFENNLYYDKEVVPGPILDSIAKLLSFRSFMGNANRLFTPTWNGPQYGNFHASKALAELTASLAQAKINRYKE